MPPERSNILILGGTGQARSLAGRLDADARFSVTTSLAGVTRAPQAITGKVRSGGFGGPEGLRSFLEEEGVDLLIDAVHPFAARMSSNAAQAAKAADIPVLRLERPPWAEQPGDRWTGVSDSAAAAQAIPRGARALVTVGRQEIAPFLERDGISVIARMIEPPDCSIPQHAEIILARPPFAQEEETELMTNRHIEVLVTKNSGGDATVAKISAARALGLPVIMVVRPEKPSVRTAGDVDEMMTLIDRALD